MNAQHATHTPGPWNIAEENCGEGLNITDSSGRRVAHTARFFRNYEEIDSQESKANAAFMISACNAHDELISALRQIAEYGTRGDVLIARAALAKAGAL